MEAGHCAVSLPDREASISRPSREVMGPERMSPMNFNFCFIEVFLHKMLKKINISDFITNE